MGCLSKFRSLSKIFIVASFVMPSIGYGETLHGALTKAYNHSGVLEQNRALLRAADENVVQANAALLPIVNWTADVSRRWSRTLMLAEAGGAKISSANWSGSLRLSSSLTLYDGGENAFAVKAAQESVLATRAGLVALEQQIFTATVQAYMNVRQAEETVKLRQSNYRVISEELSAAKDRYEVGEVTKTDVALAEARLASSTGALAAARGTLAQAQASYLATVGEKPINLISPKKMPAFPRSVDGAIAIARASHPDLKQAQHQIKANELTLDRIKASSKTKITLNGGIGYSDNNSDMVAHNFDASVSLGAQGVLYQGGAIASRERQAIANLQASRAALHVANHTIEQNVASAIAMLDVARASRVATEKQISAAQVAFDGVKEEALVGSRTTLDVLNAEQELLDAKAQLITAISDEYVAAYQVLASMGKLTVDTLNLPVRRYDPAEYYNLVKSSPKKNSEQGQKLDRILKAINN